MHRFIALAAISVALIATSVCAEAPPPGWRTKGAAQSTDKVPSFTIGLRWKNEEHLDNAHDGIFSPEAAKINAMREAATPGFESINAAMAGWRDLLEPTAEDFAAVKIWLKSASAKCTQNWDHFSCEGVSVAQMSVLFPGVSFGRVFHTSLPGKQKRVRILTETQPEDLVALVNKRLRLPMVSLISGISTFNVQTLLNARPQAMDRFHTKTPLVGEGQQIQWPLPKTGAPVLLNVLAISPLPTPVVTSAAIILAPFCADGSVPSAFGALSCTNASTTPVAINIHASNGTHKWTQTFDQLACKGFPDNDFKPFCEVIVSGLVPWGQYSFEASLTFKNNHTGPLGQMKNFNATKFEPSSIRSDITNFFVEQQAGPSALHELYSVPASAQPAKDAWKTSNVTQGVIELSGIANGAFAMSDLATYMSNHHVSSYNPAMVQEVGPDETEAAGEATLDIEMVMAVAQNTATVFYSQVAGESLNGWIVKWLRKLVTPNGAFKHTPPSVWSCSYGGPDIEDTVHLFEAEKYFKFLSGSGVTFTTASGDSGAWGGQISYPASSKYNIAVGATSSRGPTTNPDTHVCNAHDSDMITSSGGFSTTVKAPSWQSGFVPAGSTGRGLPDIAALGSYINIVQGGQSQPVWGTSASSPIAAGLISLANTARAAANKPTLAYANHFFYKADKTSFHDIVNGDNCYGRSAGLSLGFKSWTKCYQAAKGWDAATGRGTLDFPTFVKAAVSWSNPAPPPTLPPGPTEAPTVPAPTLAPGATSAPVSPMTPTPQAPGTPAPAPANGTFTQTICSTELCLSGCVSHNLPTNTCLKANPSGSAKAKCGSLGIFITIDFYTSSDCSGTPQSQTLPLDACLEAEGGKSLKYACGKASAEEINAESFSRVQLKL